MSDTTQDFFNTFYDRSMELYDYMKTYVRLQSHDFKRTIRYLKNIDKIHEDDLSEIIRNYNFELSKSILPEAQYTRYEIDVLGEKKILNYWQLWQLKDEIDGIINYKSRESDIQYRYEALRSAERYIIYAWKDFQRKEAAAYEMIAALSKEMS